MDPNKATHRELGNVRPAVGGDHFWRLTVAVFFFTGRLSVAGSSQE